MTAREMDKRLPQTPCKRSDIIVRELDGEAVLYDPRSGAVHRFNAATLTVWNACDGSTDLGGMTETFADRFGLSTERADAHVRKAIRELAKRDVFLDADDVEVRVLGESTNEPAGKRFASTIPTRREVLSGGAATLLVTAPVISTFFAVGAYASGPSASGAFGDGGCKTTGYSCSVNPDCCEAPSDQSCEGGTCCLKPGESGCSADADCCQGEVCSSGTCSG